MKATNLNGENTMTAESISTSTENIKPRDLGLCIGSSSWRYFSYKEATDNQLLHVRAQCWRNYFKAKPNNGWEKVAEAESWRECATFVERELSGVRGIWNPKDVRPKYTPDDRAVIINPSFFISQG